MSKSFLSSVRINQLEKRVKTTEDTLVKVLERLDKIEKDMNVLKLRQKLG